MEQLTALLTVEEFAIQCRISDRTVRRMVDEGRVAAVYLNEPARRLLRIPASEVARLSTPPRAGEELEMSA